MHVIAKIAALVLLSGLAAAGVYGQFAGPSGHDNFHDKTILRPPVNSKVAIIVFEDLGCPACAAAHHWEAEAAAKAHVPLVRYDFPIPAHIWTFQGAVCARYLQDTLKNPQLAEAYRSDVFKAQMQIASKDDLRAFTAGWLRQHGQMLPFVMDPTGELTRKVQADRELGLRLNVAYTPTIVVVTQNNYQVVCGTKDGPEDPARILPVVEAALAQAKTAPPPRAPHR